MTAQEEVLYFNSRIGRLYKKQSLQYLLTMTIIYFLSKLLTKNIILISVYTLPDSSLKEIKSSLKPILNNTGRNNKDLYLVGDFNQSVQMLQLQEAVLRKNGMS